MTRHPHIPAETLADQARAADPARSAWVSANAGSGKTHVLTQRVIRLLLDGVEPSRILCLTYTKAAAANMANRVFAALSRWAVLDAPTLSAEIAALDGRQPKDERLVHARRLFARALETPGGLKIQTIHAFCESVLQQFPLEANIAGHFELLDGVMETALVAEARRDMLGGLGGGDDTPLVEAFATVLSHGGESGLEKLLGEIVAKRDRLRTFIDQIGDPDGRMDALFDEFGLPVDETTARIAEASWPMPGFEPDIIVRLDAEAERTDARQIIDGMLPGLKAALREPDPERRFRLAASGLLTGKGEPYADSRFKKALVQAMPDIVERYREATRFVQAALERIALRGMLDATRSALVVADRLIGRYECLKSGRGFLDFNDLIGRTVRLLARPDASAWVQYKLDRGIDHLLVDEAQDTSPDQWQVIRGLTAEFFAGFGARGNALRTVFAVGDEKQSIYSFQGAEPRAFADAGQDFAGRARAIGRDFTHVRLRHSFRSTEDVLQAVDRVFERASARRGIATGEEPIEHPAIRAGLPGSVEIWPSVAPEAVEEPDDWTTPIDQTSAPALRLAQAIATTISAWIETDEMLPGVGRPIRPGDVMVLVRRRDSFVHALSRALKTAQFPVPVAGADRLNLRDHIAVQDLVALGRFVLQPDDDLSLAALLKSPVFGFSDDDLFDLSRLRGERGSLHHALDAARSTRADFAAAHERLSHWRDEARAGGVFDFYSALLGRDGLQARIVARLGPDAGEILDEFLAFCLAEEKTGLPGLETFLATLGAAGPEIKRQMDQTRDEVQIMTVHAAKGLEAPIVFLVDNGASPFSSSHLPRLVPLRSQNGLWSGDGFVWRAASGVANPVSRGVEQRIADAAEEEYRRLLYVGMTRAEDRLIVCGYQGKRPGQEERWHQLVADALIGAEGSEERHDARTGMSIHRFTIPARRAVAVPEMPERTRPEPAASFPPFLREPVPPAPKLPRPLAPSAAGAVVEPDLARCGRRSLVAEGNAAASSFAALRGTVVHRLLEALPTIAPDQRHPIALAHLARIGAGWTESQRRDIWGSVLAVIEDPAIAPLFSADARAEVGVMGTLTIGGEQRSVSGKIDRMAVAGDQVLAADFKTGRPVPASLGQIPEPHLAQMALYGRLLADIYPGRRIETVLVYTQGPVVYRLPPDLLGSALARLERT